MMDCPRSSVQEFQPTLPCRLTAAAVACSNSTACFLHRCQWILASTECMNVLASSAASGDAFIVPQPAPSGLSIYDYMYQPGHAHVSACRLRFGGQPYRGGCCAAGGLLWNAVRPGLHRGGRGLPPRQLGHFLPAPAGHGTRRPSSAGSSDSRTATRPTRMRLHRKDLSRGGQG